MFFNIRSQALLFGSQALLVRMSEMHMQYPIEKLGHTIDETCHAIGIRRTKIYSEIKAGRLKVVKVGRRSLVVNVREYMAEKMREAGHAEAA